MKISSPLFYGGQNDTLPMDEEGKGKNIENNLQIFERYQKKTGNNCTSNGKLQVVTTLIFCIDYEKKYISFSLKFLRNQIDQIKGK